MIPLSRKLRQLRGWQRLTLSECARKSCLQVKHLAAIEEEGRRWKQDNVASDAALLSRLAQSYGLTTEVLDRLLEDEWEWRISARDGNPKTLPRLSQYTYRPLPESAHNLFRDGFVVLDCETTGKDPHVGTEICEITILDTDGAPLLNSLVRPSTPIPDDVIALHGITNEMVASAPTFREIGSDVARLIHGQTVVIFNAGYDAWLLDRLFIENYGLDMPDFQPWCLMLAYAEYFKAPGKYGSYAWQSLSAACAQQGLEWEADAHRSLADSTMTWRLLQKMAMQYGA